MQKLFNILQAAARKTNIIITHSSKETQATYIIPGLVITLNKTLEGP